MRLFVGPLRDVDGDAHHDTSDEASAGDSQAPTEENLAELLPVDGLQIPVDEGNTDNGTSDALGGGDGETKLGGEEDGDGGSKLHGVATGGGVLGDAVAQVAHDVVAKGPEADTEGETTNSLDPVGGVRLLADDTRLPDNVLGGEGANGVGDIVGTVGNGHDHGGADLGGGPEMLHLVVKDGGALVDVLEAAGLVADDVAGDAVAGDHADGGPDALGMGPGEAVDGLEILLAGLVDGGLGGVATVGGDGLLAGVHGDALAFLLDGVGLGVVVVAGVLAGVVVGDDGDLGLAGPVQVVAVLEQKGTHGDVPEAEAGVLLDELGVEVGDEEEGSDDKDTAKDTEDDATGLASTHLLNGGDAVTTVHDEEEGEDTSSEGIVEGNNTEGSLEGVLAGVDKDADAQHDDCAKTSGNERGDTPRGGNLADTVALPSPLDLELEGDADTDHGADEGLGGGDGETSAGTDGQPDGGASLGDDHGKDEGTGGLLEGVEGKDTLADGLGDLFAKGDGTDELGNDGELDSVSVEMVCACCRVYLHSRPGPG